MRCDPAPVCASSGERVPETGGGCREAGATPGDAPSRRLFHMIDQPPARVRPTPGAVRALVSAATSLCLRSSDRWIDAVVER